MTAAELAPLESKTSRFPKVGMKNAIPLGARLSEHGCACRDENGCRRLMDVGLERSIAVRRVSQRAKGFDLIETRKLKIGDSVPVLPPEVTLSTSCFCAINPRAGGGFFNGGLFEG